MSSITLQQARKVLAGAEERADEIGVAMNIAVVDAGNNLTAFARQDGAWLGSIEIAQDKAFTARAFDMPTAQLAEIAQPGGPLYGIAVSNGGRVIVFPGGIPLKSGDEVIGAIGVSGGQVDQDQTVAEAGAAALSEIAA
ncbi:MAG TPA: heme-binding protein [Solirubrobacteraceae bacterium]|nr:heme-binding protein [Solirubrobacteraceae bacterium]